MRTQSVTDVIRENISKLNVEYGAQSNLTRSYTMRDFNHASVKAGMAGGLTPLVTLLGSASPNVQRYAVAVLSKMSNFSTNNKSAIRKAVGTAQKYTEALYNALVWSLSEKCSDKTMTRKIFSLISELEQEVLDAVLKQLLDGSRHVIQAVVIDLKNKRHELAGSYEARDVRALRRVLHHIKGGVCHLGSNTLMTVLEELHAAVKSCFQDKEYLDSVYYKAMEAIDEFCRQFDLSTN